MSKTVIFTGGQKKDVAPMAVLALNIRDVCPNLADKLIIFHDGIEGKDQKLIQSIFPTEFRYFSFNLPQSVYESNSSIRYFSQMVFSKFQCFELLNEYDRVIWTDYDVVINHDLEELKDESRGGLQLIMSEGTLRYKFKEDMPEDFLRKYDMESDAGVSTPLLVLTKEIGDYNKYYEWCVSTTKKYAQYLNMPEEGIFSLLVQEFKIPLYPLPKPCYALHYRSDAADAAIHHAIGQPKFWNGLSNEKWNGYYSQWLRMGGTKYKMTLSERIARVKYLWLKHKNDRIRNQKNNSGL